MKSELMWWRTDGVTPTSEEFDIVYPTEWYPIGELLEKVEYRRLSIDTYQLRSPTHVLIVNAEGFELSKDVTLQGVVIFEDWCARNHVIPVLRKEESNAQ